MNAPNFIPVDPQEAGENLRSCIPHKRSAALGYEDGFMGKEPVSVAEFYQRINRSPDDALWRDSYSLYEKGWEAGAQQREENGKALGILPI